MTKRQNIIVTVSLAIACVGAYRAAYIKTDRSAPLSVVPVEPVLAKNTQVIPVANPAPQSSPTVLKAIAVGTLPPIGEKPDGASSESDGKDVVDGKQVLPPVGQFIPGRPSAFDPAHAGPAMEHVGKNTSDPDLPEERDGASASKSSDPLLRDPDPRNITPPVVSQETR